jgi:hypothetical protein
MTNADVVKEIAFWALTHFHSLVGDHFDMTDEELAKLLSWLKEDVKLTIESLSDRWEGEVK